MPLVYLSEPCNEPARLRAAAALTRRAPPPSVDVTALARDRQRAARRLATLIDTLEAVLTAAGTPVVRAATAAEAADRITAIAAGTPLAVTRSAVIGELHPFLTERAVTPVATYGPGTMEFVSRKKRFWELPPHAPSSNWCTEPAPVAAGPRRDVVGLFSANAASAASGALYLLQHSQNIGNLLRTARSLIFVVAVDKIACDDIAARRQVEAVGTFGADSVLLDLARAKPLGNPLDQFAAVAEAAPAIEVILLDNGRTGLLHSQYRSLLNCIGCRACATRCPTYPEFRGPRAWSPKDYLWSHVRGDNPSLDLCTLCGNCEVDCPVDIPLPTLIAERRAEHIAAHGRGAAGWRRRVHGAVERLDQCLSAAAPLSNWVQQLPMAPAVMDKVFGLAPQRRLPPFHRGTLRRWYTGRTHRPRGGRALVYYFGCFANYNDPAVGQATVRLLEALGHDVILPEWRCCGIPLYAKGEIEAARRMAAFNIATLAAYVEAGHEIVTSCPSCQLALARDYPRLFPSSQTDWVATHTHFVSRFLLAPAGLEGRAAAVPKRAAYHLPCHLRALGMETDSLRLLGQIPGLSVTNINRGCCGLSGTFGLERDHYAQSMDIGDGLLTAMKDDAFDLLLTDCGACKLQIEHGTGRTVTHPVEVLCRAVESGAAGTQAQRPADGDARGAAA
ncbi:MAG: anaerobic glycerol-3-phosphate dehydrogenase subunit C [Candidatus Binatia bacterium]